MNFEWIDQFITKDNVLTFAVLYFCFSIIKDLIKRNKVNGTKLNPAKDAHQIIEEENVKKILEMMKSVKKHSEEQAKKIGSVLRYVKAIKNYLNGDKNALNAVDYD